MSLTFKKTKLLIALTVICGTITLLYTACKKQFGVESLNTNPVVENAKTWFTNEIVNKEKELLAAPFSKLPRDSRTRIFARMQKLSALLKWEDAHVYNQGGIQFVITPVDQKIKPLKNQNFEACRSIVFFKDNSGKYNMNVIEVLSSKDNSLGIETQEIFGIAFANKQLNTSKQIKSVNADIIFYDANYSYLGSFKTKNGKWSGAKIHLNNKKGATTKKRIASTMNQRTSCQTCTTWYLVGFWYDMQTGQVVDYEILNQWEECIDNNPPPVYGDGNDPGVDYDCLNNCINSANELSNGVQVASETINIDVNSIDAITKNKNPKWRILKNVTWSLNSQEYGVVKLVDVQTNKWQWESLSHGPITKEGFTLGGTISFTQGVGTPSFTGGTQNILYAGMSLNFEVTYSPVCNCPGVSDIIPPYTASYTSNAIWDAKP